MADDLMIEVTGSVKGAESALERVKEKIKSMQAVFEEATPSLTAFTEKMNSLAMSSKAVSAIKSFTDSTSKSALTAKDAESKMAMYQARLDRATVSMDKSRVASEKLASAQKKLNESAGIDAANTAFLNNFQYKGFSNEASKFNNTAAPDIGTPDIPTPPMGSARLASEMNVPSATIPMKFNTAPAISAVDQMREYIDKISPSVSHMSSAAQSEFEKLSAELFRISSQIDNQRALYHQLSSAATQAANATGEGSTKYLQLEKRLLSTDGAIDKLIAKQDKLKAQMSGISSSTDKASKGFSLFGDSAEKSASKATTGFQKTMNMMEKMFIRILAFRIFSAVQQSLTDGFNNMAQGSKQANATLSALATSSLYLKNSIAASIMPLVQSLTPLITSLVDSLAGFFNMVGMLTARIFGNATTVTVAKKATVDYAASIAKTGDAAKEAQKSILGFDEINALMKNNISSNGIPDATDMFQTMKIPANTLALADKIKEKLQALQPLFKGLKEVFGGFWDAIKNFTKTYLYQWLVDVGNWMEAHPDTMYKLGKGLGYVAIGLSAFKAIKWLGDVTGITKLVSWLSKLHNGTKDVTKAFDEKNRSLQEQTKRTDSETNGVRNLVPWLLGATAAALGLGAAFGKVKFPSLNPGAEPQIGKSPVSVPAPVPAPAFVPAIAPAIILTDFLASKTEYLKSIIAPEILTAIAPAIALKDFIASKLDYLKEIEPPKFLPALAPAIILTKFFQSKKDYQADVNPPKVNQASAPAIDLQSGFFPSLEQAKIAITLFSTSTSSNISKWGNNVMTNLQKVSNYIPVALASGLNAAGKNVADWVNNTSSNVAQWGKNVITNIGKTMEGWFQNFVGGLSAAWNQFTGFMQGVGEKIGSWWDANKSWAAPAAVATVAAIGVTAAIIATGGAAAPAVLALAPIGLATGGLVTAPTYSLIGEGNDNEAVLPLNDKVYSQIAQGISGNGGNEASADRIIDRLDALEQAIRNIRIDLTMYADDRAIAQASNRGNGRIDISHHPIATT